MESIAPHVSLDFDDLGGDNALPSTYDFLSDAIPLDSDAARKIEMMIKASVPVARLVSCRRFANKKLWGPYISRRDVVAQENIVDHKPDPNIKLFFHATKDPGEIVGTGQATNSEGFDFRPANEGAYGMGSYFATCAAYAVFIHPTRTNADGTFTFILAEVACGSVMDLKDSVDCSLRMPPERRPGFLHHSVRGTERSIGIRLSMSIAHGEQYVIYNHNQAYPHFVVTIELVTTSIVSKWKPDQKIHMEHNRIEVGSAEEEWLSAQWTLHKIGDDVYHIASRWKRDQKIHMQSGLIEVGTTKETWLSAQWKLQKVRDGVYEIVSAWKSDKKIHMQSGRIEVGAAEDGWLSAQWTLQEVVDDVYRIVSKWKPDQMIHIEYQQIMVSPALDDWQSAQWMLHEVGDGAYCIVSRWKPNQRIHMRSSRIEVGTAEDECLSAQWTLQKVGDDAYRIASKWKSDHKINFESGRIAVGAVEDGWLSALWKLDGMGFT